MYIDKLYDIANKYKNTYHRTIKMKPVGVNRNMHNDFNKENNKVGRKFKIGVLLEYQNIEAIFAKEYVRNSSAEIFHITKVKNTVSWTYVISYLKDEEIVEIF